MSMTESPSDLRVLIDDFFARSFSTDNVLITEAIRRMLAAGGKRLRPRLTLLAAQAVGGNIEEHLAIASYIELIHVATLIHDDVVDGAQQRRGVNATAIDFGNQISVLAGDYLFAWIFKNVTADYPAPVPHILSATLAAICDGEVLQLRSLADVQQGVQTYLDIIAKKTASLFGAATECGAILGGGDADQISALRRFGVTIGNVFQIRDDIADLTSSSEELGKPVGHDLIEGKVTLPLILALQQLAPEARAAAADFYRGNRHDPQDVLALIARGNGIAAAKQYADDLLDGACAELALLPLDRQAPLLAVANSLRSSASAS